LHFHYAPDTYFSPNFRAFKVAGKIAVDGLSGCPLPPHLVTFARLFGLQANA
jgi:hypothetical protein